MRGTIKESYSHSEKYLGGPKSRFDIIVFLTGIMAITHAIILIPLIVNLTFLIFLLGLTLLLHISNHGFKFDSIVGIYLAWYGLFTVLICISMIYTVNTINPEYALTRVLTAFGLGFIVSVRVRTEEKFRVLANGIMIGGIIVICVAFAVEGFNMGIGRIGGATIGSAVALSGFLFVAYICAIWRLIYVKQNRLLFVLIALATFAVIILTGSRRSMILSMIMLLLLVFFNKETKKSKKAIAFFITILLLCVFMYFVFTNETLYNLIGWRIESMFNSISLGVDNAEDASMQERAVMKEYGYELFFEKPIFGYGSHGFAYMFDRYYGKLLYSHCGFSEILSCYGIVGFVIFYKIFISFIKKTKYVFSKGSSIQVMLLSFALLTLISDSNSIAFLNPPMVVLLVAGINMLYKIDLTDRNKLELRVRNA